MVAPTPPLALDRLQQSGASPDWAQSPRGDPKLVPVDMLMKARPRRGDAPRAPLDDAPPRSSWTSPRAARTSRRPRAPASSRGQKCRVRTDRSRAVARTRGRGRRRGRGVRPSTKAHLRRGRVVRPSTTLPQVELGRRILALEPSNKLVHDHLPALQIRLKLQADETSDDDDE